MAKWNIPEGKIYTQADLDAAVTAALREAAAMCRVLKSFPQLQSIGSTISDDLAQDILSMIPDAGAALDRYVKERSDEALREAADAVEDYCSDAPDLAGHGHSGAIRDVILGTRGEE